ncbi:two component transcriptional regulator, LuxR family [Lentzea xinjiangensis]|uniref:Two component transcriptional regulator, LuxR family n=1 Tax=Lentzea xinjiangensis TaxID=402600 RepID=A0A1H9UF17_9PSEU|nr:response regulator [Lentzea xinjiangensis]SES07861.1 two component transcriptional regulator, LuxR family [Lentzea xinjiangensis]
MACDGVTSVVVVDDHPAITAGVRAWCAAARPPVEVVDIGTTPAVAWAGAGAGADVVVFDLHLAGEVPAYAELRRLVDAERQVVVYTMREDRETVLACLELGAFAYLTKAEGPEHLIAAVHAAHHDLPFTTPTMARAISGDRSSDRPKLTPREIDVLVCWFACESKEMVARKLGLSVRTVSSYIDRARIRYANAGRPAATKAALVARAVQDGLIALEDL